MAKRTTIHDILERKKRQWHSNVALWRIGDLARAWSKLDKDTDVSDFIPIRAVTIIEVFVRESVKEIVDSAPEYFDKAEVLLKDIKFDFLAAKSLYGRRVTLGDIVAHSISVNNLEQIVSTYETLLPGYRNALPTVSERWIEDRDRATREPVIKDVERVLAVIRRLFEVRHIVVHELPREKHYTINDVHEYLSSTEDFLAATDWYITGQLKGDIPRTQSTMNRVAGDELSAETTTMEQVLAAIGERGEADAALLKASQDAWTNFARADSNLHASLVAGGSMQPSVWAFQMTQLTRARIGGLRWWLEREEGDVIDSYGTV